MISLGGLPLLYLQQFDFNPDESAQPEGRIRLRPISTCGVIRQRGVNAIDILAPSLADARDDRRRLRKCRRSIADHDAREFRSGQSGDEAGAHSEGRQGARSALAQAAASGSRPMARMWPRSIAAAAASCKPRRAQTGPGADAAKRLAAVMTQLGAGRSGLRGARRSRRSFRRSGLDLDGLRGLLQAQPVTAGTLPPEIAHDWITPDGRARVQVYPKGDPNDNEVLRQFARAVLAVEPTRHRRPDLDPGSRPHRRHAFIQAGASRFALDRDPAVDHAATARRRAADADPADVGGRRDARDLRC